MGNKVVVLAEGKKITLQNGKLNVPKSPIIPFIEGDGIGVGVTPPMIKIVDAIVEKAYKGERKVSWMRIYAGEKSTQVYGQDVWLPAETLDLIREYRVAIRNPLATPVGGGICSLNVTLCQEFDLYAYLRSICYYQGTPSPVKHPELTDVVIFRENSKGVYVGIKWKTDSAGAEKVVKLLREETDVKKTRFLEHCGIGTRPCSKEGTKRLVYATIKYAIVNNRDSAILTRKGNIMEFTEDTFKNWGYQLTREEFGDELVDGGLWMKIKNPKTGKEIVVKDITADAFLQQTLLCPAEHDVIACMNLNGDYISGVLTTQVGGIGIALGANIGGEHALFEATHDTTPKYVDQNKVNPGSITLSVEMILRHMGWVGMADPTVKGIEGVINTRTITYGFERLMDGIKLLKCSELSDTTIGNM